MRIPSAISFSIRALCSDQTPAKPASDPIKSVVEPINGGLTCAYTPSILVEASVKSLATTSISVCTAAMPCSLDCLTVLTTSKTPVSPALIFCVKPSSADLIAAFRSTVSCAI